DRPNRPKDAIHPGNHSRFCGPVLLSERPNQANTGPRNRPNGGRPEPPCALSVNYGSQNRGSSECPEPARAMPALAHVATIPVDWPTSRPQRQTAPFPGPWALGLPNRLLPGRRRSAVLVRRGELGAPNGVRRSDPLKVPLREPGLDRGRQVPPDALEVGS